MTEALPARGQYLDGEWHRLHPATPLLRGGIGVLAVAGWLFANLREQISHWVLGGPDVGGDPVEELQRHGLLLTAVLVALGVLVVFVAIFWVSWRASEFRIADGSVTVKHGVLLRTTRTAKLDRIQGVTLSRPLFARLVGAARVELDVAGQNANVRLEYLSSGAAEELRRDVLGLSSGAGRSAVGDDGAPNAEMPGVRILTITPARAVVSVLLSETTVFWILVLAVGIPVLVGLGGVLAVFSLVPVTIGAVTVAFRRVGRNLRFTVTATADGVRIGAGLISTSSEAVPPNRVHAVRVEQPLLWRPVGWWRVRVNRAGHIGGRRNSELERSIAPVATLPEVLALLPHLVPVLGGSAHLLESGVVGDDGFVTAPRRARWLRPIAWHRTGFALVDGALLIRGGWFRRHFTVVPLARMQSVALHRNPVERMLGVATVAPHVVAGPVPTSIGLVDIDRATVLFDELAVTGQHARAQEPGRWGVPHRDLQA